VNATGHHLRLQDLSKHYAGAVALDAMTLDVARGEMVVLLGPSGCGKTTTLRLIAGFVQASRGEILLDGSSILSLPPHRREMGIVFQSYALFPHLSVARNVAFGLEMRRLDARAIAARVDEMLRLVKLDALAHRLPRQLSGGQQQRVALARALAIQPKVLLLDEPLSNLDAALRQEVARDIRILQRDGGLTAIMVTHDQDEAMAMADRLVVMQDGRVQQIGTQEDLYERPASPFVARFIGRSNIVPGRLRDGTHLELDGGGAVALAARYADEGRCTLAVRPERITLASGIGCVAGRVELGTYLGAVVEHVVRIAPDTRIVVRNASGMSRLFAPGTTVALSWNSDGERLFDAADRPFLPLNGLHNEPSRETSHA
jgi:putative spermidine/putrescine transport system ATP-binding protein